MKTRKLIAIAAAVTTMLSVAACSSNGDKAADTTRSSTTAQSTTATQQDLPTAAELNEVLARVVDPAVPNEEKAQAIQGGEQAPELFDTMVRAKEESGAEFRVEDPVMEGDSPNSALALVTFTLPDRPEQNVKDVEFVYEDGTWKLSTKWACMLITNVVPPEQVPAMCTDGNDAAPAAPAEGMEAPAEGEAQQ